MDEKKDKKKEEGKKNNKGNKENKINKNKVANIILAIGLFFSIGFFAGQQDFFNKEKRSYLTLEEAKSKTKTFVEENLVPPETEVKIKELSEEEGLYKVTLLIGEQEVESYVSKNGEEFFPQSMNIAEIEEQTKAMVEGDQVAQKEIPKQDKPLVEAFIMSYCPYGTQVQKGLLPVVELLKDKIDFDFKFVNYAMHEKEEIDENLVQYCMNETNQDKYYQYLECFLVENDSDKCLASSGFNKNKINQCVETTDNEYEITAKYNDKESWKGQFPPFDIQKEENEKYGIKGSPTLIVNGVEASSGRDSKSLLATICNSFTEVPSECQQDLSSTIPAPGFGEGVAASAGEVDCSE